MASFAFETRVSKEPRRRKQIACALVMFLRFSMYVFARRRQLLGKAARKQFSDFYRRRSSGEFRGDDDDDDNSTSAEKPPPSSKVQLSRLKPVKRMTLDGLLLGAGDLDDVFDDGSVPHQCSAIVFAILFYRGFMILRSHSYFLRYCCRCCFLSSPLLLLLRPRPPYT